MGWENRCACEGRPPVGEKAATMAKEVLMDETVQQQLTEIADLKKRLDSEKQKSAQLEGELQLARKRSR